MKINKKQIKRAMLGYTFLGPPIIGFFAFTLIPVIASLVLAFMEWDIIRPPVWVGFQNYIRLFHDKDFWYYIYNTVYFVLSLPLGLAFSLFLALLVNQKLKGISLFRTIYFFPVISSVVACALIWRWIYNGDYGLLNAFLKYIGIYNPPNWLRDVVWAKPALIIMGTWKGAGSSMLIYLAALQSIPEELYESANIDGATGWKKFWHITLPMLSFANFYLIITGIMGSFQVFSEPFMMTGGGPLGSTTTVVYAIYTNAFQQFRMGYASAISWFLFLVIFTTTLVQWNYGGGKKYYY
ncbi:MAG: hypothetical protein A3J83_01985 [Elusimicrobia bacterium RIFOXYA2_FULL_40_6]|nr:MAG: hypothetical protein A3J83_01985 [Elusimicrobia bacterium RIFOXYA2_FULL_40_6]